MRAAVVPGFGQPLVIEDRPVPEPGPGQVVERDGVDHAISVIASVRMIRASSW
jgi:hypothetical protein